MAVALTFPANPASTIVANRRFTISATLTESGGTATNFVSINPFALNADGTKVAPNVRFGQVANAATIGGYTGAAVVISANGTLVLNFDAVIDEPFMFGMPAAVRSTYQFGCTCSTSDGEVFSAPLQVVNVTQSVSPPPNESLGQTPILGTTKPMYSNVQGPGILGFNSALNAYLVPLVLY